MGDADQIVDAALEQVVELPSSRTFRVWCEAHRAGRANEEALKRAFRDVWSGLANGRYDDFMRLLASAEARVGALRREQVVGWAQAAVARAALELMHSRRLPSDAAEARRAKASDIAAAALRFIELARSSSQPI